MSEFRESTEAEMGRLGGDIEQLAKNVRSLTSKFGSQTHKQGEMEMKLAHLAKEQTILKEKAKKKMSQSVVPS